MTLIEELKIFVKNIFNWICFFIGFSLLFFIFGPIPVTILGRIYYLPMPAENSFSVQIFNWVRADLLPPDVQLIVTNPMSAFLSQMLFSAILAFLSTIPLLIYKIVVYLHPALLPHERKALLWSLLPFTLLFFSGCAFSYFLLVPATFKILYPYATIIGAVPFFSLDEFLYYVLSLMVGVGIMFLLPIFMIILSYIRIIKAEFWRTKWRHSVLFFLILSAIITPDGTGITMAMLFLPLALLYLVGYLLAEKLSRRP